jgi:asparagine synthase (glutamine-hydrolysing)
MFAFALWDRRKQELLLARDRLGVKPLYYVHAADGSLYFASEIKSLLAGNAIAPRLNIRALPDYLANHAPTGEETLFEGVRRLPPGHILCWREGRINLHRYWDIEDGFAQANHAHSEKGCIQEWMELFRASVRLRLMSDVPLGMFLSGGIDSSAIAAVMSEMVDEPIKTFAVAFAEREANELHYARVVAHQFKTDHFEVVVPAERFFETLPKLVWHEDEPLAHPSSVALYFVSRLAAEHVKVVLTGEGSDELLAGYGRYRKTVLNLILGRRYHRWTPAVLRQAVQGLIRSMPGRSCLRQRLLRTFLCLEPDIDSMYFDNFAVFSRSAQAHLLSPEVKAASGADDPYSGLRHLYASPNGRSVLENLLYTDMKTYLHELLMKQDQMSMAASIESRVPFLDHKLVEYTTGLPERLKLHGSTTKYILRKAFTGVLPDEILSRRKMGFPVPLRRWFREQHRWVTAEYVLSPRAAGRGLFDRTYVGRIVKEHEQGATDHSERLWSLVNLEIWMRLFLDGEWNGQAALPSTRDTSSRVPEQAWRYGN